MLPPIALLTARLSTVSCCVWSRPYGRDWPIERILPVPGSTWTTEAATLSSLLTFEVAASLAASWARGERVVLMVRPPRFHSLERSSAVFPNAGSERMVLRT